ncbi:MAG TPA: cyclic nucleotide-binding domain-containing protein [Anaerolineales bacterium]|nr:cyclic nucleotide-binding domain-containing protein [Anaerolineales bacterium]
MSVNLSQVPLFNGLTPQQLNTLKPLFESYSCPRGTAIFEQGQEADYLYLILNGNVTIQYKPYDGPFITISHLSSGGVFGWSAAIGSGEYTSRAECLEALEALRIRGRDLEQLCLDYPETGAIILDRLAQVVSSRWKHAHEQVRSLLQKGKDGLAKSPNN